MATTVGDTLASSKLAVAQDDLHLAGSSVDQLTIQFDQLAFDDLLAPDRKGPNKGRRSEDRQPATRGVAPSSPTGSVPSPDHRPLPNSAPQPAIKSKTPYGSLNRRHQQPRKPKWGSESLIQDGRSPRGSHSPQKTRIRRAKTPADAEGPLNRGHTPAARILQEAEIEPLYKILLHKRKVRPLAQPQPVHLTRHPKFCTYHQLVGHPTSKCRSLRERLEGLVRKGVVAINPRSEPASANATSRRHRSPRSPVKALPLPGSSQTVPSGHYSPSQQPSTPRCHLLSSQTKQSRVHEASSSKYPLVARTKSQSCSDDISAKTSLDPGKWTSKESPITHGSPLKLPA